jgi:hypothetical protein
VSADFWDLQRVLRRLDAAEKVVAEARRLPREDWTRAFTYSLQVHAESVAQDNGALRRVHVDG